MAGIIAASMRSGRQKMTTLLYEKFMEKPYGVICELLVLLELQGASARKYVYTCMAVALES